MLIFENTHRALHAHLQPKVVTSYGPVLMKHARQHMIDLLEDPSRHQDHAKRCVMSWAERREQTN